MYALADSDGGLLIGPGVVSQIIPLSASTGVASGDAITLSKAIYLGYGSAIFSGYNRMVLVQSSGSTSYNVDPYSGLVYELGDAMSRWHVSSGWAAWGVAEFTGHTDVYIVYTTIGGTIERQKLSLGDGGDDDLQNVFSQSLGTVGSITFDISEHRWYFYYTGVGVFGEFTQGVGFAAATSQPSQSPSQPTSQPSSQPTYVPTGDGYDGNGQFLILDLLETNSHVVNASSYVDSFYGGIALSDSKVFISGKSATLGLLKADLSLSNSVVSVAHGNFSFVSNLATRVMYAMVDDEYNFMTGPGEFSNLAPLDASTGLSTGSGQIALSTSIHLDYDSGIFSGYNRIVVVDSASTRAYNVNPLTGKVTVLGYAMPYWHCGHGWAAWGVAEYYDGGLVNLLYSTSTGTIQRQQLYGQYSVSTVYSGHLGSVSSFTYDIPSQRWFFYFTGHSSAFGNYSQGLGYADAHYALAQPSSQPSQQPSSSPSAIPSQKPLHHPTSQPSRQPSSRPSSRPTFNPTSPTSQPTRQPSSNPSSAGYEEGMFFVTALRSSGSNVVNVTSLAHAFYGGIALSATKVFVAGRSQILGLPKTNLSTSGVLTTLNSGNYSLVSNLKTQQVYALVDDSFNFLMGPGTVANLVPLDAGRGVYLTGNKVSLSQSVYLPMGSGIFSGWNRIVLVNRLTSLAYNLDPLDGKVQELSAAMVRWQTGNGWASWGVAEYTGDTDISILYSTTTGVIERQNLYGIYATETVHSSSLGAISSFTVDTKLNRWYFFYSGVSGFGNYSEAPVSDPSSQPTGRPVTSKPSGQPTSRPTGQPTSQPTNPTSQPTRQPSSVPTGAGYVEGTFFVSSLTNTNSVVVNITSLAHKFNGGIALSATKVFVAGRSQILG
eukprot:gene30166-37333_t